MVENQSPYLPDILREIVEAVNQVTSNYPDEDDRFTVGFNHGRLEQVAKDIYNTETADVLVWLPMNFDEMVGSEEIFADAVIDLLIGTKTDNKYTQLERDDMTFKPMLIPVYEELIKQMQLSPHFRVEPGKKITHKRQLKPYWGGGAEPKGTDVKNLWKEFIDAILIIGARIKVEPKQDCKPFSNI